MSKRPHLIVIILPLLLVAGCQTVTEIGTVVTEVGTAVAEASGHVTAEEAESIRRVSGGVLRTFEDISPEQEYFIGRSVAATVLESYSVYDQQQATAYLNLLGQALAMASDRPETFGGYRFLILDSDEINAFAAPGGFIFVSRGMLQLCASEDELAAVLAHEIGHVQHRHGLRAIRSSRITAAGTILATESGRHLLGDEVRELTEAFAGAIDDISQTLMVNGYGRRLEREADATAVEIMRRVGYDPSALIRMLAAMDRGLQPGALDFAKTHPPPQSRISDIRRLPGVMSPPAPPPAARVARFQKFRSQI